jgi:phage/plasmid-associated DNA primase
MVVLVKSYFCKKGETPEEKTCMMHEVSKDLLSEWGVEKLGSKTKLFLDYDCNVEGKSKEWIEKEKKAIRNLLIEYSTHYANGFVFTETNQPDKISFHIIFKRIAIDRASFHPELERDLFSKILGQDRYKYPDVDESVYHKKLWFRLPYGTLPGKPFPHIPYYPNDLSDYILTVADDTQTKNYDIHPYMINKKYQELLNEYKYERDEDEEPDLTARQERIIHYLEEIKPERFVNHKEWFQLMCICRGNSIPAHIFLDLSEKSGYKKFNREACMKQFEALEPKHTFGFPLLHKWLDEDGIDWKAMYPQLSPIVRAVKNLERNDFGCTDQGLASVLFQFYGGNMYYTASHGWIHWNGKRWEMGNDASIFYPICKMLSSELKVYVQAQMDKQEKRILKLTSLAKADRADDFSVVLATEKLKLERLNDEYKRYRHIQSVSCIKNVLQMSMALFRNDLIINKFDTKPHLFSFDDASIDLRTGEIVPFTKEQFILTTCGYPMPKRNGDASIIVHSLLESISGDNIDAFIQNTSVFLYGGNTNECFNVWEGRGRNGKGLVDLLLQITLGNYYQSLPISELVEDSKGAGRTSSEVANCRWARLVVSTEPEHGAKFKVGKIKQYTGNDPINARQLYKEAFSFLPKFTLLVQLNGDLMLSKPDDAIQKRMLITEFPFQFVEKPEREYQRKIDDTLKTKIREDTTYRDGFFYLLLDAFIKGKGKVVRTKNNDEKLDEMIENNSPLADFLRDYEPCTQFVRINVLYDTYIVNNQHMKQSEFKNLLLDLKKIKTEEDKSNGMKVFLKRK